jgi:hypothetical protein
MKRTLDRKSDCMDISLIREAAINEILNPTFEVTRQYLSVNKLIYDNNIPVIEDIIFDSKESFASVYFPIFEEDYFFVVYVDFEEQIEIRAVSTSPGNRVYFSVTTEEHTLDELIKIIDFEPTKKWNKGDRRGYSGIYDFSAIKFEKYLKKTGEVEEKLNQLLDYLLPRIEMVKALKEIAELEICIAYHGYQIEMWGIHFNKEIISKLSQLDIEVDIDIYAGGPELLE